METMNFIERVNAIMGNLKKSKKIIAFSADAFVNTSNCQTVDIGESEKGSSFKEAQREVIDLRLDNKIESDDFTIIIKPAQIIKASPEFIEQAKQRKEEFLKPATGLLDTTLEITPEGNAIKLDFSLRNMSGESLSFYFSSGQKYDIFIRNHKGGEVYKWSHDKDFLTAIVDMELNKDEKLACTEAWDYRDDEGNRVPPGKYSTVVIWLAKVESGEIISTDELTAVKDIEVN